MKNLIKLWLALFLLSPSLSFAQGKSPSSWHEFCTTQNSEIRRFSSSQKDIPNPIKGIINMISSDNVCSCIQKELLKIKATAFSDSEASMLKYLKANSFCTAENLNSEFPARCHNIYSELLPIMGFKSPTEEELNNVCACASRVTKEKITSESLFEENMRAYREYQAKVKGELGKDQRSKERSPLDTSLREIQACALETLGRPIN